MANSVKEKVNNNAGTLKVDVIAVVAVLIIIAGYIFFECYNATHVDVETITAVTSTVYETIEAKALVIRDEHTVENNNSAVTVACVADGEKVKVNGNIAMEFPNEEVAKSYSLLQDLHRELDYYVELESKSAGIATDVDTIDRDILSDINDYVRSANYGSVGNLSVCMDDLNDKLTRRQMIIGKDIDFTAVKTDLQNRINSINVNSCSPTGYLATDESGIFSSYTDGFEKLFDYDNIENLDIATLKGYIDQVENSEKGAQSFGKLITTYEWYFCAAVSADDVKSIKNGDMLDVAVKDSDAIIRCQVLSGADVPLGTSETVLILKSSQMDSSITSMRLEDIEIRYNSYSGFKVPSTAIHIDDDGNKCVYALVANQVSLRQCDVVYSTKDYALFAYEPNNSNSIRYYDQIIIKGKDLHDGKVYT